MRAFKFVILLIFINILNVDAQIRLPKLISDNMVLQRDKPIRIWGWASPKEKITLTLNKNKYKTTTDVSGKWEIMLPAQSAATAQEITLKGKNEITIKNVAFGDVWFCSGQSNMEHNMERHNIIYAKEIAEANNENIRQFRIPNTPNVSGIADDFNSGSWLVSTPENVNQFSVVAYFFVKKL